MFEIYVHITDACIMRNYQSGILEKNRIYMIMLQKLAKPAVREASYWGLSLFIDF